MSKKSDVLRWNLLLVKTFLKVVEMTTKDLEYYVVFIDKTGAGFETNDPNFESSTVGNILSNSTAGYRRNVVHERKSQWTQQTSLLSYFKKLSQ